MKVAVLAHLRHPIAPPFAGGLEAYTWHLVEGLMERGHKVVLFASGDSDRRFTLDAAIPVHHELSYPGCEHRGDVGLKTHIDAGYSAACDRIATGGFDILHNNSLSRLPLQHQRTASVPTLTSLHVPPYDALRWFVHDSVSPSHRITVTSQAQMKAWWPGGAPPEVSVLHNGIDPRSWPYQEPGDGSAVWCGRISPSKGTHLAVAAARQAGLSLNLFGPIEEQGYWETQVQPLIGGAVRYGGHLTGKTLAYEIGRSSVFLFTPCWDEPFGLVAIEAMACGLPVAATDMGAAREVIGSAGRLAKLGDEVALVRAIGEAFSIPRWVPRARVLRLFTRDLWLARCEILYENVLRRRVIY